MQDRTSDRDETLRLDPAEIPEMALPVGLHGASRHAEITGSACFSIVVTLSIYAHHG